MILSHQKFTRWFLALAALALCSCETDLPPVKTQPFSAKTRVGAGAYELQLTPGKDVPKTASSLPPVLQPAATRGQTTSVYALVDTRTGKTLGQAESAITQARLGHGTLRGERVIEISPDGEGILVQEDVSDLLPSRRYILFQRQPDGSFQTWYLAPPVIPIPAYQGKPATYSFRWIHFSDPGYPYYPRFPTAFNR